MSKKIKPCLSGISGQFDTTKSQSICSSSHDIATETISTKSASQQFLDHDTYSLDEPCICICGEQEQEETPKKPDRAMLITGFGMRSHSSLQRALLDDEQRRAMLLHQYHDAGSEEGLSLSAGSSLGSHKFTTDFSSQSQDGSKTFLTLEYLMGLTMGAAEEAPEPGVEPCIEELPGEFEEVGKGHLAMKRAQKYLRTHQIFQFYQFLIAHLLSALPENPISFLLGLLDKCLLYRTGLGFPPLLYEKPHLEQLFYLMDRMRTGFIELEQYKTAMATLGICSYNLNPPLTSCGMVPKDVFIEEAYECLTDLFQEMIRRRGVKLSKTSSLMTPPPTEVTKSVRSTVDGAGGG